MANNFANTAGCKAVWRFESGLTTADSQNNNTLTNNGVTNDTSIFKEGAASALFNGSSYLYINDASLITGFPLRSDDAVKKFSFTCWIRPTATGQCTVFANTNYSQTQGLKVYTSGGYLYIRFTNGTAWQVCNITSSQWYHLGITGDGIAKTVHVRVYDVTAGVATNYDHTFSVTLSLGANPFVIGAEDPFYENKYTGNVDELVPFNFQISDADIDAIRNGTYTAPTTAVVGSVAVSVGAPGVIGESTPASVSLAVVGSVGIEVGSESVIGGVKPAATPVIGSVAVKIDCTGVPASKGVDYLAQVVGSVAVEIGSESVTTVTMPPVLAVVGSVGVLVGGKGVVSKPPATAVVGSVALRVGGVGIIIGVVPVPAPVLAAVGTVGIEVGGSGAPAVIFPPVLAVIGSVGIQIGEFRVPELTVVKIVMPADLTLAAVIGSVGIEVGGAAAVAQATPPIYVHPPPHPADEAMIKIGSASVIAFIHPLILEVIGDAEILIGGSPVGNDIFDTYVLTGARGEPSIYSNFKFNSYAEYRGQYFGAGLGGICLLEGEDDAGQAIRPGIRIGPANLGTDREKRIRLLRCGGKTTGAQVKVSDDQGNAGYYDVENGRAAVSREVQGRELTIEISDFETLDHLEIAPLVLAKR